MSTDTALMPATPSTIHDVISQLDELLDRLDAVEYGFRQINDMSAAGVEAIVFEVKQLLLKARRQLVAEDLHGTDPGGAITRVASVMRQRVQAVESCERDLEGWSAAIERRRELCAEQTRVEAERNTLAEFLEPADPNDIRDQLGAMIDRLQKVEHAMSGKSANEAIRIRTLAIDAAKDASRAQSSVQQALATAAKQPQMAAVALDGIRRGLQSNEHAVAFIEREAARFKAGEKG